MRNAPILILDDDPDVGFAARLMLQRKFGEVIVLTDLRRLLAELDRTRPAVVLLDMNFTPGRTNGEEGLRLLSQIVSRSDAPPVIVLTAYAEVSLAVDAVKRGAFDFIPKPWDNAKLCATVAAALAQRPSDAAAPADMLLGSAPAMQSLRAMIASVAPTEANVLILGENGVGKELVARAIHAASRRSDGPFLPVDMGALPESTFESELFGHRRGSFTDARQDRPGRFQSARSGTLFLDEIGNLSLASQAKLLTVLERREVTPLGADRAEPVDVRIVSATNLDEARLFDPQVFRADLLYRINTIVLRVPPLRERREDILPLAQHYLAHYARKYGKDLRAISPDAQQALQASSWPGNVRDLRHSCERAVILACGMQYEAADFSIGVAAPVQALRSDAPLQLADRERDAIASAMRQADGNISEAARLLGVSRPALYRKLEKYGL
ncbi:sigma-54 dependent transcriptional regulator [Niveibacterium sp. 24ML]|uniref:sigma-54-dependent transcriptional regulator n=1 Tax=Niveibacterium sp. 24ML TaxID=2985512 RepID=UPI00226DB5B9|nr:sigma-54 dependent transcriptional regulator [Niveibacterium sp. 24ML]MCX9155435.1 sigma-54 dependent transcriptional regulator [Niveibacterium sp. 24ML]